MGDLNCDILKSPCESHTRKLQFLSSLYQFDQLIDEPTRITGTSATLIDLILTNKEENISKSGVIHLGLSDHSMIFAIRKHCIPKSRENVKYIRNFKNFNANDFLTDLSQTPWENIAQYDNPNVCWRVWYSLYLQVLDRHAPLRRMRTRGNSLPWISWIFNLSIKKGEYVDEWKKAWVIPIYKSDDRLKCENYRPISILPIVSKILERCVFNQIYKFLNDNSLLSKHQHGFRPKHSTLTALTQMCDTLYENMDNGQLSGIVFLDIRKAFDSIDHNILLDKLKDQFGISDIELRWFESYLTNREQVCIVNNSMSSSKRIVSGVPQGSILGPLLFLLYINDLPECLQKTTPYLYADDTQISCSSNSLIELIENLNHDLNRIGEWLSRNKLQHHPTKTKIMFIGSKHLINSITFDHPVMLKNQRISRVHSFTCLGLELDENLNWNAHIQAICKKVGAGLGTLKRIKPFVPTSTLQTIYRALIQPYFDYCSPIWGVCDQRLKDKLQKFQNRVARIIVGASYEIRSADVLRSLAWENLETRRRTTKSILMYKVLNDYIGPTLKESLIRRNHMQTNYDLRNSPTDLALPKPKREFLKKSFKYSGAKLWNSLSIDTKLAESIHLFKSHLKLHFNAINI